MAIDNEVRRIGRFGEVKIFELGYKLRGGLKVPGNVRLSLKK